MRTNLYRDDRDDRDDGEDREYSEFRELREGGMQICVGSALPKLPKFLNLPTSAPPPLRPCSAPLPIFPHFPHQALAPPSIPLHNLGYKIFEHNELDVENFA